MNENERQNIFPRAACSCPISTLFSWSHGIRTVKDIAYNDYAFTVCLNGNTYLLRIYICNKSAHLFTLYIYIYIATWVYLKLICCITCSTPWPQFPWIGKNTADPYACTSQYGVPMSSRTQPPDPSMVAAFSAGASTMTSIASNPYGLPSQSYSHNHSTAHYPSSLSVSSQLASETATTSTSTSGSSPSLKPSPSVLGVPWSQFPWIGKSASDSYGAAPQYGLSMHQKGLGIDSSSLTAEVPTSQIDMSSSYTFSHQDGLTTQYLAPSPHLPPANTTANLIHLNPPESVGSPGCTAITTSAPKPCSNTEFLSPLSSAINPLPTAGHGPSQHGHTASQFSKLNFW